MDKFLSIGVGGLATAAIYAVAASGLVLTYSTTGTFNFAHGAIGMMSAFLYWQLHYDWGWPTPLALAAVLLVAGPLFGAALERLIFRRLEGTAETTRMVVTISLLLGMLGLSVAIWNPQENRPLRQFFQGNVVELGGVRIPWYQFVSMGVAIAVAIGLKILLYRTRQGVAMRAAVDNRALCALNGASPDRSSALAWAMGCSLAALSGILIAPTLTLSAVPLTLLIINAYGAAVFGRLRSLPLTFLGAVILGLAHDYGVGYLTSFPDQLEPYLRGLINAIPAIILFIVVLLLPASRLGRVGRTREIAFKPSWGGSLGLAAAVVIGTAMVAPLLSDSDLVAIGKVWGLGIVALSMVPLFGLSGQLSLSQLSFAAFGAIAYVHLGWDNPLGLVWGGLVAAVASVLIALPVIRLQGIYVALATAAFTVLCDRWLFQLPEFHIGDHAFQVFQTGTLDVIRPHLFGLDLTSPEAFFVYASVVFSLMLIAVVAVRRSPFGARLIAIKEGPAAVATAGINVTALKIAVFALSGAIAGIGGCILSAAEPANSSTFDLIAGLPLLLVVVLGGVSSVGAAVFAGIFLGSPLTSKITFINFGKWQNALIGLAGIGLGNNPNGTTADFRPLSARVKADPPVLIGLLVAIGAIWGLAISDVLSNGWFFGLCLLAAFIAANIATRRHVGRVSEAMDDPAGAGTLHGVIGTTAAEAAIRTPPELLGLTVPFSQAEVDALDDALDLRSAHRRVEVAARA